MPAKKPLPPVDKRHWNQVGAKPQRELILDFLRAHPTTAFTVQEIAQGIGFPIGRTSANISSYKHRLPLIQLPAREGEKALRYQFDPHKPDGLAPTTTAKKDELPVVRDRHPVPTAINGHRAVNGVQRRKAHVKNEIFARVLYDGSDFTLLETQNGDIIKGRVLR